MRLLRSPALRHAALLLALVACTADSALGPAASTSAPLMDVAPAAVAASAIVINEIMADPSKVADAVGEWIELYNGTAAPINLQGWKIASANDAVHTISQSVVVQPGAYAVLVRNMDAAVNGGVVGAYSYATTSPATLNLNNGTTDWLVMKDPSNVTVDSVAWGTSSPPSGSSRSLRDVSLDNAVMSGANWFTSTTVFGAGDKGTPGTANDGAPPPASGPVTVVTLSPSSITVSLGTVRKFIPVAKDAAGNVVSTTYTWTSTNPAVATVDATGSALAVGAGSTTITARSANGIDGSAIYNVAPSAAVYRNHLEFGTATDATPDDDYVMMKPQFALSYNRNRNVANWVSWNLNASHFGVEPRSNVFTADQSLPAGFYRVVTSDYTSSGYSRGHMVRSEERTATVADNESTFLLTNILPQYQDMNGGPWFKLELYLQNKAQQENKEMYVIAGGIFPANGPTLKNEGKVAIPSSTWKIVVILPAGQGLANVTSASSLEVIAVNMPNVTGILSAPWEPYTTTVNFIEQATGYDFLDKLPDDIELLVEANDRAPVASAGGPYAGSEGQAVTFNGTGSTDADNDPLTYVWSFSDGSTASGATPTRTFADNGTYTATLTVSDPAGATSSSDASITIANTAPIALFTAPASALEGESFLLTMDGAVDPSPADVIAGFTTEFDCGAGAGFVVATSPMTCATSDNGERTVRARITDKDGGSSVYAGQVSVLNVAPTVQLSANGALSVISGQTFSVSGSFSDPGVSDAPWSFSVNWGFGVPTLGSTSDQLGTIDASRTFTTAGVYTVTFAVTDKDGGTGTSSVQLDVRRLAVAMDVNPGSLNLNEKGNGRLSVSLLSGNGFDPATVDLSTIRLGTTALSSRGNSDGAVMRGDVNGDGIDDLLLKFDRAPLIASGSLNAGTQDLVLTATLSDGRQIEGRAPVRIAGR